MKVCSFAEVLINQIAYILASAKHETDNFATMEEYASGKDYENRADLSNSQKGDGVKYKGRGYVQITGRGNYTKYTKITGKDLINNPRMVQEDKELALFILVHGMINGTFTSVNLNRYINDNSTNFIAARAIVNGNGDRAGKVARYAELYKLKLSN
jgi:predicted chitinase